jgi:cytochrome b subunit of formate dehydrogenase
MRTGRVSRGWATREHRGWFDEEARKTVGGSDEAGG